MNKCLAALFPLLLMATLASAESSSVVRRKVLLSSYGTYAGAPLLPDGTMDIPRLINELGEINANTYNWLIARSHTDWDDLQKFLPMAKEKGIRVWVTLLPPSESPPITGRYSEPFRLDFEKWAAELADLSIREPALVAWSIDDFVHNLKFFTPEYMREVIAAQRGKNDKFAFVPCVYYKKATREFADNYGVFFDGILFPYRSESTKAGFADATQVVPEIETLRERFGREFPIIVDIYATRHSRLGPSTNQYVEEVMNLAYPVAAGVHIYRHQDKHDPQQQEKYETVRRIMSTWGE